jgi:hypothetical protein
MTIDIAHRNCQRAKHGEGGRNDRLAVLPTDFFARKGIIPAKKLITPNMARFKLK